MKDISVYTIQQVAALLQISTKTMHAIVRAKDIESITVRGQIRITSVALKKYLEGGSSDG